MFESLPHALQHLRLRRLRRDDLAAFHAYRSDPDVARYQGWNPMTRPEAEKFLEIQSHGEIHLPGTWRQLGIADLDTDALLGDVGFWLSPDLSHAEFGLSIAPPLQGNGYGTECVRGLLDLTFSATSVNEVIARTDVRNLACVAMLTRAGMRQVDTKQAEYKGEVCTEHVFVALRRRTGSVS